uniref:NADP-dependent oxidoreductase domain-containing protein n=1 Tax=Dunaliella tertiolecta TaxID=3047 RepID=A0A7S3QWV0_DUNTE|eukprot:CAMPEP_0202342128 /NCGR_PEP_ID=MMETSP1126-20121109/2824_1 /ASSEMBLY_ACC=CAM_ASM_000457 /TAXON_ID=3047 /ORGANISM="Dunaliella tertiolecta, Strain CCMP1320" /LENGTH=309 /DNA_ID=CAMNT_0048933037 /DNA_START=28 /DNA_END=957 /DNA_ORIENTATION=-
MATPLTQSDTLYNKNTIPLLGLGTWKMSGKEAYESVVAAVKMGYRHIDCAPVYNNEKQVGDAFQQLFKEGVVKREELFVTSKILNSKNIEEGIRKTLSDLQLSYLDLYLVHAPASAEPGPTIKPPLIDQWRIMESLHDKGLARSIGVSNFSNKKLQGILEQCRVKPHVHQVEAHPNLRNDELLQFNKAQGIHVTAYSPLGTPDSAEMMKRTPEQPIPLQDPVVLEVAKKMNKTPAQVLLRYGIQRGMSVVPKSVHPERIKENTDIFNWSLSEEDFKALHTRPNQVRLCHLSFMLNPEGPFKTMQDLWDN